MTILKRVITAGTILLTLLLCRTGTYSQTSRTKMMRVKEHLVRGDEYFRTRDFRRALEEYLEASRIAPENDMLHENLGITYQMLKEYDLAINEYIIALKFNPENANVHYNLGTLYELKGNLSLALSEYQRVLSINPGDGDARIRVEYLEKRTGKKGEVEKGRPAPISGKGVDVAPEKRKESMKHTERGNEFFLQKNYSLAIEEYLKAIELYPANPIAHHDFGQLYFALDEYDLAMEEVKKALEFDPGHYGALYLMGLILEKKGEKGRAIQAFQKALDIEPNFLKAAEGLSRVLNYTPSPPAGGRGEILPDLNPLFCPFCGRKLPPSANFCPYDGKRVRE